VGLLGSSTCFVDAKWNVTCPFNEGRGEGRPIWSMIPNEGKDNDLPVWNWDNKRTEKAPLSSTESTALPGFEPTDVFVAPDGAIYMVAEAGKFGEQPPISWPNNVHAVSRFVKWDKEGHEEFSVGRHTQLKNGPPGNFANIRAILGQVQGNLVVRD